MGVNSRPGLLLRRGVPCGFRPTRRSWVDVWLNRVLFGPVIRRSGSVNCSVYPGAIQAFVGA